MGKAICTYVADNFPGVRLKIQCDIDDIDFSPSSLLALVRFANFLCRHKGAVWVQLQNYTKQPRLTQIRLYKIIRKLQKLGLQKGEITQSQENGVCQQCKKPLLLISFTHASQIMGSDYLVKLISARYCTDFECLRWGQICESMQDYGVRTLDLEDNARTLEIVS